MAPFVGRQPELAVLQARLSEALARRPQTVQIQGPAGIGKTALLDHFLSGPGSEPPPVLLSASGEETEQLLAYGVLDQLVRSTDAPLRLSSGEGGSGPAPLDLVPGRASDQVDDPVTVGARFLEFLDRLDGRGVVLAVDDAHWADRPSLQALIFDCGGWSPTGCWRSSRFVTTGRPTCRRVLAG
jgi:hypothetical protein